MDTYRCFIAIDLPEQLKDILADVQQRLSGWPASVKWVERRNLHLTLKFLGDTSELQIASLKKSLATLCEKHQKFEISVRGLGAFPTVKSPKVIWSGVEDPQKQLQTLWTGIEAEAVKLGFPAETRPFSPHLTLGRVKESRPVPGFADTLRSLELVETKIPVTEVRLMKSLLFGQGPEYSSLGVFAMQ